MWLNKMVGLTKFLKLKECFSWSLMEKGKQIHIGSTDFKINSNESDSKTQVGSPFAESWGKETTEIKEEESIPYSKPRRWGAKQRAKTKKHKRKWSDTTYQKFKMCKPAWPVWLSS